MFDLASLHEITCHCEIVPTIFKCEVSMRGPKMAEWEVVFSAGSELKLVISQAIDPIWL